jgi:hypothetical protein
MLNINRTFYGKHEECSHLYFLYEFLLVQEHHLHVVGADSLAEAAHREELMTSHYRHEVSAPTAGRAMSRLYRIVVIPDG